MALQGRSKAPEGVQRLRPLRRQGWQAIKQMSWIEVELIILKACALADSVWVIFKRSGS